MFPEYATLNILLVVALWLLLPLISPLNKIWRIAVLSVMLVVQVCYAWWRFNSTVNAFEWSPETLWQYSFLVSEMMVVLYTIWQCITLTRFTDRSRQCDELVAKVSLSALPTVDLYIPTYSESKKILSATIAAAQKDKYKKLTIWICDDGQRPWLQKLCSDMKVNYLCRPLAGRIKTKAANLQWSIEQGSADYIVCLDADFQCEPDCITRLTSFLSQPEIGLAQAPQHFRNPDPIQRNLLGSHAWTEEQRFFFDVSLPSRDAFDNALCVGSCWAVRRNVLDELGGFPVDSIVEDVYLGYRLKSLDYRIAYLNEKLAIGLAAEDTHSYVAQRSRWCQGAVALLRDKHGPIKGRGLSLLDRIFYFEISFYWLTHIHLLLLLVAPALYGFFGVNVFNCTTDQLLSVIIPKNILFCAGIYWISQGRCMPLITLVQRTISIFQVLSAIVRGLASPGMMEFKVTGKDIEHTHRYIHWRIAAPFIAIGVITVLAMLKVFSQNYSEVYWSDYTVYNAVLAAYSLITVFLCCLACVEKPTSCKDSTQNIPVTGSLKHTTMMLGKRVFF